MYWSISLDQHNIITYDRDVEIAHSGETYILPVTELDLSFCFDILCCLIPYCFKFMDVDTEVH